MKLDTYEMSQNPDIVLAMNYLMLGVNFWESAKIVDKQLEKNDDGTPKKFTAIPFYFLVSHSIELFLKSALIKRGYTGKKLKDEYGHNLKKLLNALQNKGVVVTNLTIETIIGLHEQHMNQEIRYFKMFGKTKICWLPTNIINEALDELQSLVRISTQGR